ncbi:MAG: hypothetical protein RIB64_14435 [Arenibacter algicola]
MKTLKLFVLLTIGVLFITCSNEKDVTNDPVIDPVEENVSSASLFELTKPLRGDYIISEAGSSPLFTVEGKACDDINEVINVDINASSLPLTDYEADCVSFGTELVGKWGLNTILGKTVNDQGNEVSIVQSNLISSEFLSPLSSLIPNALKLRLDQEIIDDFDRTDIDDFSTVLNLTLNHSLDLGVRALDDEIPDILHDGIKTTRPICGSCLILFHGDDSYEDCPSRIVGGKETNGYYTQTNKEGIEIRKAGPLQIGGISHNYVYLKDGKLNITIGLEEIIFPVSVDIYEDIAPNRECLADGQVRYNPSGTIGFRVLEMNLIYDLNSNGESIDMVLEDIQITALWDSNIDFTPSELINSALNNVLANVASRFTNILIPPLLSILGIGCDALNNEIIPILTITSDAGIPIGHDFSDFQWRADCAYFSIVGLLDKFLDISGDISGNIPDLDTTNTALGVDLMIEAKTSQVNIGDGFIDYSLDLIVLPVNNINDKEEDLLIIGPSNAPIFDEMGGTFGIGLKHDLINNILWALWAGGGFDDIDTSEILNTLNQDQRLQELDLKIVSIETGTPPVMMPGSSNSDVIFGVGEINLIAEMIVPNLELIDGQPSITEATESLTIIVSTFLPANIELDSDENKLLFTFINEDIQAEVEIKSSINTQAMDDLKHIIGDIISGLMKDKITDFPPLPIPTIPIGDPDIGIPEGSALKLTNGQLNNTEGYFKIIGEMFGVEN